MTAPVLTNRSKNQTLREWNKRQILSAAITFIRMAKWCILSGHIKLRICVIMSELDIYSMNDKILKN